MKISKNKIIGHLLLAPRKCEKAIIGALLDIPTNKRHPEDVPDFIACMDMCEKLGFTIEDMVASRLYRLPIWKSVIDVWGQVSCLIDKGDNFVANDVLSKAIYSAK